MSIHSALLDLPAELRALGLDVVTLGPDFDYTGSLGWEEAQGAYWWQDPHPQDPDRWDLPPTCYMVHGTAGTAASPVVRDSRGRWSVANAWTGLWRGTPDYRLYAAGAGDPLIVLTAAGPGRYTSGYGYWPTYEEFIATDRATEAPYKQTQRDGTRALNRWAFNLENVHPNDGSPYGPGIYDTIVGLGVALHRLFGWQDRTLGHLTWTTRKPVDPKADGRGDIIVPIREAIAEEAGDVARSKIYPRLNMGGVGGADGQWTGSEAERLSVEHYMMRVAQMATGLVYQPGQRTTSAWLSEHVPGLTPFLYDEAFRALLEGILRAEGWDDDEARSSSEAIGERQEQSLMDHWQTIFPGRLW